MPVNVELFGTGIPLAEHVKGCADVRRGPNGYGPESMWFLKRSGGWLCGSLRCRCPSRLWVDGIYVRVSAQSWWARLCGARVLSFVQLRPSAEGAALGVLFFAPCAGDGSCQPLGIEG